MSEVEMCCSCDCPTGEAGRGEGSRYANDEYGPYCEDCWMEVPELLGQKVDEQQDTIARLKKLLARYRDETPVGNQPHMICVEVDRALDRGTT